MRALLVFLLVAALAGCAAPAPPSAPPADDGLSVVAVRVVPLNHTEAWHGALGMAPCDVRPSEPCTRRQLDVLGQAQVGLEDNAAEQTVTEPAVLFWRLAGLIQVKGGLEPQQLQLTAYATTPTGHQRQLLQTSGSSAITIERKDLFLETNETGLRIVLEDTDTSLRVQPVSYDGDLYVQAYIPAGDPPVVIQ